MAMPHMRTWKLNEVKKQACALMAESSFCVKASAFYESIKTTNVAEKTGLLNRKI